MVVFFNSGLRTVNFKCILNLYWNNYFNSGRYFISGCNVKLRLKFILNLYWNNYYNSGRYFNSGCDVKLSLKFILNPYWNNYLNSGRYFNSGCDVKLSLKFIVNPYWNNYFNSGRYFNSGCNTELSLPIFFDLELSRLWFVHPAFRIRDKRFGPRRYRRGHYEPWVLWKVLRKKTFV